MSSVRSWIIYALISISCAFVTISFANAEGIFKSGRFRAKSALLDRENFIPYDATYTAYPTYTTPTTSTTYTPSPLPVGPYCTPATHPEYGPVGQCIISSALSLCTDMQMTTSDDCDSFNGGNSVCCYGACSESKSHIHCSILPSGCNDESTTGLDDGHPTTTPDFPSTFPPITNDTGEYVRSHKAVVREQQCGIPNGDPNVFTHIERRKNKAMFRRVRLTKSKQNRPKSDPARFTIQQTILGGFEAPNGTGSLCWQVSTIRLTPTGRVLICSGVIIGSRTILTAAHCLVDTTVAEYNASANQFLVTIGVIARDVNSPTTLFPEFVVGCARNFNVSFSIPHPDFDPVLQDNDLALLILSEPIDFRKREECACRLCLSPYIPKVGDKCITSGFGDEIDTEFGTVTPPRQAIPLKYVLQTILEPDYNICAYRYVNDDTVTNLDLFLCAGGVVGEDSCQGDSGGPLFCYNETTRTQYLAGLVSVGLGCGTGWGALYTKVGLYLPWIFNNAPLGDLSVMQ